MTYKLLPCPFCGGESLLRDRYINGVANTKHYIRECHHCKATFAHWFRSIKRANEAWNRRAILDGCENELAEEYAGDRAIFSKEDVEEVFRKSELRSFLQNKWPRYAEEMGD